MHRIVFTLAIVPLFWVAKGQVSPVITAWEVNPQVAYYDSLTYAQYLKQDYKLLIATAKKQNYRVLHSLTCITARP